MDAQTYMLIAEQLFYSEEYNQALAELIAARNINKYAKALLKVIKMQQDATKNASEE